MTNSQNAVQHAPGPWSLTDWESLDADGAIYACGIEVVDAGERAISTFITEGATEEEEANVRLIAAAPDLLAALKEIVRVLDGIGDLNDAFMDPVAWRESKAEDAIRTSCAAISKALGEVGPKVT